MVRASACPPGTSYTIEVLGARGATIVTVFVDTNVLVYARDRSEADKQRRAAQWMARASDG